MGLSVAYGVDAADPSAATADAKDLSGVYRDSEGAAVRILQPGQGGGRWVMQPQAATARSMTFYLQGDASGLAPQGVDAQSVLNGRDLRITAEGDRVYAEADVDGKRLEVVGDTSRGFDVLVDGEAPKADDDDTTGLEARRTLEDFALVWKRMRASRVQVGKEGLVMGAVASPGSTRTTFKPVGELTDEDREQLGSLLQERARREAALRKFESAR